MNLKGMKLKKLRNKLEMIMMIIEMMQMNIEMMQMNIVKMMIIKAIMMSNNYQLNLKLHYPKLFRN